MRASGVAAVFAAAVLAACATGGADPAVDAGPSPFPVERGTAPPPPAPGTGRAAPPEGAAQAGVDFGRWRQADPAVYAPAFEAQMQARYAGQDISRVRADLEANGFACENQGRLDCRIEIMERQCAFDWYVVIERNRSAPIAGFDQTCLGAR